MAARANWRRAGRARTSSGSEGKGWAGRPLVEGALVEVWGAARSRGEAAVAAVVCA